MAAHQPQWLTEHLLELTQHRSFAVRMLVLRVAKDNRHREALKAIADSDPNAYLRGLARTELDEVANC